MFCLLSVISKLYKKDTGKDKLLFCWVLNLTGIVRVIWRHSLVSTGGRETSVSPCLISGSDIIILLTKRSTNDNYSSIRTNKLLFNSNDEIDKCS